MKHIELHEKKFIRRANVSSSFRSAMKVNHGKVTHPLLPAAKEVIKNSVTATKLMSNSYQATAWFETIVISDLEKKIVEYLNENEGADDDIIAQELNVDLLEIRDAIDRLIELEIIGQLQ